MTEKPEINLEVLTLKDKDIILAKVTEEYYSKENADIVIKAIQETLEVVAGDKIIGILLVRNPNEINILDDSSLINLGLVKLKKMVDVLGIHEVSNIMERLGFEEQHPFENPEPEVIEEKKEYEIKYMVHTNEEYSLNDMAGLYDVDINECFEISSDSITIHNENIKDYDNYYHLYPKLDNKWTVPTRKGR